MAKRKINKSKVIREFLNANAEVGPTEAAKQLTSQLGTKITPAFVSNIKQKMGKRKGSNGKAKRGRKPVQSSGGGVSSGATALSVIRAARALITSVGSVEDAKAVLDEMGNS